MGVLQTSPVDDACAGSVLFETDGELFLFDWRRLWEPYNSVRGVNSPVFSFILLTIVQSFPLSDMPLYFSTGLFAPVN